ncbi:MAG: N-acetylmuramoyl-L-alanine amidase-like domain-containing protein [Flavobacteriaceae bacterium]
MSIPKIFLFFAVFIGSQLCSAQEMVFNESDQERLNALVAAQGANSSFENISEIGSSFLGSPYVAHTIEGFQNEPLVLNFSAFDCTTFVENSLSLYFLQYENLEEFATEENHLKTYAQLLEDIRYRNRERAGYTSRLHYFTEWIQNNEKKGYVFDITEDLGGSTIKKTLDFMSSHRSSYSALKDDRIFEEWVEIEKALNPMNYAVLGLDAIKNAAIEEGDIIAFATNIDGLDVTHTGIAIEKNKKIHLLHASSSGSVVISKKPLYKFAQGINRCTGIIIVRPALYDVF